MLNLYKVVIPSTARGYRITGLSCGRGNKLVIEPRISVKRSKKRCSHCMPCGWAISG